MLYFAYGSNMNPQRAAKRMPDARAVGIGILHGWQLVERLYADIEPAEGQSVIGVLYQVGGNDLARLDRCEGYPHIYCRKTVTVDCGDFKVIAQTCHMNTAPGAKGTAFRIRSIIGKSAPQGRTSITYQINTGEN